MLGTHVSRPHNPLIAGSFFRTGDIESWGRGIEKVRNACIEYGTDFPTFQFMPSGLLVVFKGHIPGEDTTQKMMENAEKTPMKTSAAILALLREQPTLTLAEVATHIGKSLSAAARTVKILGDQGKLKYVGPQKGGHWEVIEVTRELK